MPCSSLLMHIKNTDQLQDTKLLTLFLSAYAVIQRHYHCVTYLLWEIVPFRYERMHQERFSLLHHVIFPLKTNFFPLYLPNLIFSFLHFFTSSSQKKPSVFKMSNLLPVCLLLFVVSATVIAYPAEQAGNFVDLDELFNFENAPIEPAENVAFDR